jgi:DNA-binding NarL/FixJ family response regulator
LPDGGNVKDHEQLTKRELEVILKILCGFTNREIAQILGISVKTVESHRARVMRKLGLHSIVELVRYAIRAGIVTR